MVVQVVAALIPDHCTLLGAVPAPILAATTKSRTAVMYLAIGASELASAKAVELFTSYACIFSEPLEASARLPNCKNCHLFVPVYPPALDSSQQR